MRLGARTLAATCTVVALMAGLASCGEDPSSEPERSDLQDLRGLPLAQVGSLLPEDLSGWLLVDVDGFGDRIGEYEVNNADAAHDSSGPAKNQAEVTVTWRDPADYEDYLADRRDVSAPEQVEVADDKSADLFTYSDHDFTALLFVEAPREVFIELRGTFVSREDFLEFLDSMHSGTRADFDRLLRDSGLTLDADGSA